MLNNAPFNCFTLTPFIIFYVSGNLSGDSQHAYWNHSDFNLMFLLTCIHSGLAPITELQIEMTPVDFVSRVIVTLTKVN